MDSMVRRLRDCANGVGDFKTGRGDFGLCEDAADEIEALSKALSRCAFVLAVMPDIALRVGLAGTSQWDDIAGGPDLFGALDEARSALKEAE